MVLDKEDAHARKGIFIVDAGAGFMKDGPKNRLRAMDIHKIVDVFNRRLEVPKYSRMVGFEEIEKNDFNLNIPRYIDSREPEDIQDIEGHLRGGIPVADIDALERYWAVCPQLRKALFKKNRPGYVDLAVENAAIKPAIYDHPEFTAFIGGMNALFAKWRKRTAAKLKALEAGCHPKQIAAELSEDLLAHYAGKPLIDKYDVYQRLMDYWAETMQDDCYIVAADGWKAETTRVLVKNKNGREVDKGWTCDLIPKSLIVARYFATEQKAIAELEAELESVTAEMTELEEENAGEDGAFFEWEKINKAAVSARLKELDPAAASLSVWGGHSWLRTGIPAGTPAKGRRSRVLDGAEAPVPSRIPVSVPRPIGSGQPEPRPKGGAGASACQPPMSSANGDPQDEAQKEAEVLQSWLALSDREAALKRSLNEAEAALDAKAYAKYPTLTEAEIQTLVVDDKWLAALDAAIHAEMDRISQALTARVKELDDRYETPMPQHAQKVAKFEQAVNRHLQKMGFSWD